MIVPAAASSLAVYLLGVMSGAWCYVCQVDSKKSLWH